MSHALRLDKPATAVAISSPVDHFRTALTAIAQIAERVLTRVDTEEPDTLVATPIGGMLLKDHLPTRTFELTVHTCDLAVALDQPMEVPLTAATESLSVIGGLAAQGGNAGPLLLAATGRRNLPLGFTVL